ncbi:hypothetical protein F511_35332 [Dorcoceras hygrometricum]|uniref:Uncharacterized protein n=1 Tax=Dorcoceras hygrometricum TaxID=472368 RepID=A0A2Z7D3I0_9LAMI|nr:hypothetical protein F511_35332 [Dorcoceras hygrometricum]
MLATADILKSFLVAVDPSIKSMTGIDLPPISLHYKAEGFYRQWILLEKLVGTSPASGGGGARRRRREGLGREGAVRLAKSPHDPLGITDSACKNQLVVVSVQYRPFNPYIPIRSTTIGKSRVAIDPIAMRTSWRSNSDITSDIHACLRAVNLRQRCIDSYMHRGLTQSRRLMTPSESANEPNEGSSIDHQVTIYLHAQNITMFPTNETWYFASQILVSNSGDLILILTAQSTRNMFRIHSDY